MILRFTLELRRRNNPSSAILLSKSENGSLGRVKTFIRRLDAQITEDFGNPSFPSCGPEDQHLDEDVSVGGSQGVHDKSIPCITTEEYPWVVNTIRDLESGTENRFN